MPVKTNNLLSLILKGLPYTFLLALIAGLIALLSPYAAESIYISALIAILNIVDDVIRPAQ